MEVASLLTVNKNIENLFKEFIFTHSALGFDSEDADTYYFINKKTGKYEIFYHFNNDLEYELSYNFLPENIAYIKKYFKNKPMYLIDISFIDKIFFSVFLVEFIKVLKTNSIQLDELVIDDPFRGLLVIDNNGQIIEVKV